MLDKAIEHGKEKRKPYRGSKRFDRSCWNHGDCVWCEANRNHKFKYWLDKDKYLIEYLEELTNSE